MLTYSKEHKLFCWKGDSAIGRDAGFKPLKGGMVTFSPFRAMALETHNPGLFVRLHGNMAGSNSVEPAITDYPGLYPFQSAGVEFLLSQMSTGRTQLLLADDPGCGKSPTASVLAKELGCKKVAIICPASIRLNWQRELKKWAGMDSQVVLTGSHKLDPGLSVIVSYNLVNVIKNFNPDLFIVDEAHYLRSKHAIRTRIILGAYQKQYPGLIGKTPAVFLTGTPIPNGRPNELYPLLSSCAPDVIDYLTFLQFIKKYCSYYEFSPFVPIFTGGKNLNDLYMRLRGSGFMLRRKKEDVLKDLPPKQFKLVLFSPNSKTRKILKKENQFDSSEIRKFGSRIGESAFAEVRREMAEAIVPSAREYISNLIEDGLDKVVVFGHHVNAMHQLCNNLKKYNPVMIIGSTPPVARQKAVDDFQNDPNVRIFLGNEAAEEGITLTAAQDVVLVEPEFVPGKETQRADRVHRIGQSGLVTVHMLAIEGSIAADIMSKAIDKQADINLALDEKMF
jgi:SWI/SNF-related matrix-associated actin-dependent regulator 1 of chromatin subfamily A